MKNIKQKQSLITVVGALLALCLVITALAKPFSGNTERWPGLTTSLSEEILIPGFKESWYITSNTWKAEDYKKVTFSLGNNGNSHMKDADGNVYIRPKRSGVLYSVPVPASAVHNTSGSGENGFETNLSFPAYVSSSTVPSRENIKGTHFKDENGIDLYNPTTIYYCYEYGGVQRKIPYLLIGYREDYSMPESDLPELLNQAPQFVTIMNKLNSMMAEMEGKAAGTAKAGDYHPVYDYMLDSLYDTLTGAMQEPLDIDGIGMNFTKALVERRMEKLVKDGNAKYTPEQCRQLLKAAEWYLNFVEENRISEPKMESFTLAGYPGQIDEEAGTVTVYIPADVTVSEEEEPVITTAGWTVCTKKSGDLWANTAVYNVAAYEKTTPVTYVGEVAAYHEFWADVQKDYQVIIERGTPEAQIRNFSVEIDGKTYTATVDDEQKSVSLNLPASLHAEGVQSTVSVRHTGTAYHLLDASDQELTGEQISLDALKKIQIEDTIYGRPSTYDVQISWVKSKECKILSFRLGTYEGVIDETDHRITVKVPFGKDISSLTPEVTVSDHAKYTRSDGAWQFDTPVTYVVTAEDGTTQQTYTVTVVQAALSESCEMTSFKVGNAYGVIDQDAGTVTVTVSADTNLSMVKPVIGLPEGAKVSPASEEMVDFTSPVKYTVTGASGNTKVYTVTLTKAEAVINTDMQARCQSMVDKIIARYRTSADDNWEFMNIGFYDHQKREPGDALPQTLDLEAAVKKLARNKMTDYDRGIMMLTALGVDCTKLDEYNDGKKIVHSSGVDISDLVAQLYNYPENDTINGPAFWLIAMDMGNYTIPKDAKYTRESVLNTLLNHTYGSDGFGLDMVCMIMQSLYPYRNDPAVQAKLQEGLQIILGEKSAEGVRGMEDNYTFYSTGAYNSEVVSQVICALCSMGIDPATDPRFSDGNGNSVMQKWMDTYASESDGYFYHVTGGAKDALATYEACYAMQWYLGFLKNGGSGHPYSLYADGFDFNKSFSTEASITSFTLEGKVGVIDEDAATITVTLPEGISLSGLTPEIELSKGAKLLSPDLPYSFIKDEPVAFQVQAEDGETTKIYHVTVTQADIQSSGTTLKAATIGIQDVNQRGLEIQKITTSTGADGVTEIELLLGPEADLTQLRLYAETSERATSDVDLNYKKVLDLSSWVTITLTAEDGTTKTYRIRATKNAYASIAAFSISIGDERYNGTIDHDNAQILIQGVPSNADVTSLVPNITLSEGTTGCIPLSGTAQDFTSPVNYTVTGEGLTARTYQVTVLRNGAAVEPSTPDNTDGAVWIMSFSIDGCTGVIDQDAGTIQVTMPLGTDTTSLIPSITVPDGVTVTPASGAAVNLSAPVVYTVSNSRGSRTYTVTVVLEKSISDQLWEQMEQNNTIKDEQVSRDHSTLSGAGKSDGGSYNYDQTSKDNSWLSR